MFESSWIDTSSSVVKGWISCFNSLLSFFRYLLDEIHHQFRWILLDFFPTEPVLKLRDADHDSFGLVEGPAFFGGFFRKTLR